LTVRTRVAPSPTGDPHVGTAFAALMNFLFARRHDGRFVLRVEDTDRARSTPASETAILDALRWLGIAWDEGPDVGGPYGPYRQSDRLPIYAAHAARLLVEGHAFKCFCSPERLDAMRREQQQRGLPPGYDGRCAALTSAQVAASEAAGEPFTVRMRVPREGTCVVFDLLRGHIEFPWDTIDMQVLVKSDGWPTYHLANVVDDHLMEITHVMRGEEWLPSAPKHVLLYQYFGWEMPQLAHLPLLRNADKSKLSKRKNPTGLLFYRRMGYLPEALANFLGLLAVPPLDGEEMMSMEAMIERFTLEHINVSGPVFDVGKLDWLNARYLRESLDPAQFAERVRAWAFNPSYLGAIVPLAQSRIERLSDLGPLCAFLFAGRVAVSEDELRASKLAEADLRAAFALVLDEFEAEPAWEAGAVKAVFDRVAVALHCRLRDLVRPFYVAISGRASSLPLFESMELLGRVRERLRVALHLLGGATPKESAQWRKLLAPKAAAP
jgi:glutamyl-tRNA synthetase